MKTGTAGTISLDAESGSLTMVGTTKVETTGSSLRVTAAGDITLGNLTATNVSVLSDLGSIWNAASSTKNVMATNLRLQSMQAIGLATQHLSTNVAVLTALASGTISSGTPSVGLYLTEDNGVTVDTVTVSVTDFNGDATTTSLKDNSQSDLVTGNNGNIVLVTVGGNIILNDGTDVTIGTTEVNTDGTAVLANGTGSILIDAQGTGTDLTVNADILSCLLYTSPSPRDGLLSRMPSSA